MAEVAVAEVAVAEVAGVLVAAAAAMAVTAVTATAAVGTAVALVPTEMCSIAGASPSHYHSLEILCNVDLSQ